MRNICHDKDWWKIPLKDFLAGTCAGFGGKMIEYPFDTIKVKMQTAAKGGPQVGSLACFRQTLAQGGVSALYEGLPLPLAGTMLETCFLFTAMGQAKKLLLPRGEKRDLTIGETVVAGGAAGAAVSFVLTPIELIKCRMQSAAAGTYRGTVDCLRQAVRAEGMGVLYKGQELVHYRPALPEGLELMQVVFAWRVPNPVSCNG